MAIETISPNRVKAKGKRSRKFWTILVAGALLVVIAVALGIYFYPKIQQKRLLRNARIALDKKEYAASALFARRAAQANPRSVDANRFMADLAEMAKSPEAIYWRRRVTKLEPGVLENHIAFARAALQNNKLDVAQEAVNGVPESARKGAVYHGLAANVALAANNPKEAESHFVEALALEPANEAYQLDLAALRIASSDPAAQNQARATLEKLLSNPALRTAALRLLIQDSINSRDWDKAVARGRELGGSPDATFDNKLVNLTLLNRLKHRDFTSYLTKLQEEAAADPQRLFALIRWMNTNGFALLAVEWSKHLPAELLSTMPVPMALAQAYVTIGDWAGLSPIIGNETTAGGRKSGAGAPDNQKPPPDWADFDFMRHALRARALRDRGSLDESRVEWSAAVQSASARPESLATLQRLAIDFKWENEAIDILWMIARGPTSNKEALSVLLKHYAKMQSTRDLLRVAARWYQIDPSDSLNKNNLASYYMLLEENTAQGIKLAEDLHKAEPENPVFSSTWAYALHLQGRSEEAVKLMKSLGEDVLQQPEYAVYYGVILAGAGKANEAKRYLELARKPSLLPEEKKLVESALQKPSVAGSSAGSSGGKTKN